MCSGDGRTQSGGVIRAGLKVVLKAKPKKGPGGGGCRSAPQTITPISSLSNGASGFEIIIIHNVQNIYNDVTGTVGKAGAQSDVTQRGCSLQFLVHDGDASGAFSFLPQLLLSLLGWSRLLRRTCECDLLRGCSGSVCREMSVRQHSSVGSSASAALTVRSPVGA